jgi:hypothetical protein
MDKALVPYWEKEVSEARELIAASKGVSNAFVGLERAKAFVAIDEELTLLRALTAGFFPRYQPGDLRQFQNIGEDWYERHLAEITPRPLEEGRAVKGQDVSDMDVARSPDATLDPSTSQGSSQSSE